MTLLFIIAPLFAAVAIFAFQAILRSARASAREAVELLSFAISRNLPLAHVLARAAAHERGGRRRRLRRLHDCLAAGDSVSTALRTAYPWYGGDEYGAIRAAEDAGTLPTVLRSMMENERRAEQAPTSQLPGAVAVNIVIVEALFAVLLTVGCAVFIAPQMKDIARDFGDPVHALFAKYPFLSLTGQTASVLAFFLVPLLLVLMQYVVGRPFMVRLPYRTSPLGVALDWLAWGLPGMRRLTTTRKLVTQLPVLLASLRNGHDLPTAARHAGDTVTNYVIRRQFRRWAERIERGEEPGAAARAAGLPGAFVRGISSAMRAEDLPARLEYLSAYYLSLAQYQRSVLAAISAPVLVGAVGLLVAYLAINVFLPVFGIVDGLIAEFW